MIQDVFSGHHQLDPHTPTNVERNSYDPFLAKFSRRSIQTPHTYLAVGELNCAKSFS